MGDFERLGERIKAADPMTDVTPDLSAIRARVMSELPTTFAAGQRRHRIGGLVFRRLAAAAVVVSIAGSVHLVNEQRPAAVGTAPYPQSVHADRAIGFAPGEKLDFGSSSDASGSFLAGLERRLSAATDPAAGAGVELTGQSTASCVHGYSPAAVARHAGFAFDGTVIAIGDPRSNREGSGGPYALAGVTLRINEWFRGGDSATVVVDMPVPTTALPDGEGSPEYGIGTRLLVSGAARWGGDDPFGAAIAWWGCGGFTQYYSAEVAAEWAAAIR